MVPRIFPLLSAALLFALPLRAAEPEIGHYGDQLLTTEVGANKAPRQGPSRVLVVPVDFGDGPDFSGILPFFDPDPAAGYTFSNFFRHQSGERLNIDTYIMAPVRFESCPVPVPDCDFGVETANHAIEAMRLIFERILADLPEPLSNFDVGGEAGAPDGWVDGVMLLVPGYGGGIAPPVWPFLEIIADGVQVPYVAISNLNRETILHEFGHNLGSCDQYLWDLPNSLMSWCDDCSLDVHTRTKLEWAEVLKVAPGTEVVVDLAASVGKGSVLRVGGDREYFLIEHRTPHNVGDKVVDPKLDGLVVVHVDETVLSPFLAQSDYPKHHALLEVERAPQAPERTWLEAGDALEPHADHEPTTAEAVFRDTNWYDGRRSGIRIAVEARGLNGAGEIVLRVRVRGEGAEGTEPAIDDRTGGTTLAPVPTLDGEATGCAGGGPAGALGAVLLLFALVFRRRARVES